MSNQKYEYLIAQVDLFNAWADSEGFDIKMSSETEHSSRETHAAFLSWLSAKTQEVPEGYCVLPIEVMERTISHIGIAMCHPANYSHDEKIMAEDQRAIELAIKATNNEP